MKLGTLQYVDYRQDPAVAAARLRALIGADPGESATRVFDPRPVAADGPTIIAEGCRPMCCCSSSSRRWEAGTSNACRFSARRRSAGWTASSSGSQEDDCVSRKHAKLSVARSGSGLKLTLTDLESANGTYVNRERLLKPAGVLP